MAQAAILDISSAEMKTNEFCGIDRALGVKQRGIIEKWGGGFRKS